MLIPTMKYDDFMSTYYLGIIQLYYLRSYNRDDIEWKFVKVFVHIERMAVCMYAFSIIQINGRNNRNWPGDNRNKSENSSKSALIESFHCYSVIIWYRYAQNEAFQLFSLDHRCLLYWYISSVALVNIVTFLGCFPNILFLVRMCALVFNFSCQMKWIWFRSFYFHTYAMQWTISTFIKPFALWRF